MSATSVEDLVNQSLQLLGAKRRIGDIYEGSDPARVALELYGQTRDELLQAGDWPFAMQQGALTLVTSVPPPSPWQFEYQYPSSCLRVRYIKPGPAFSGSRSLDPQPVLYSVWNDTRQSPPIRAILCDLAGAVLVSTGQIIDMTTWEPEFTRSFVARLSAKMAPRLADSRMVQMVTIEGENEEAEAAMTTDLVAPPSSMPVMRRQAAPQGD